MQEIEYACDRNITVTMCNGACKDCRLQYFCEESVLNSERLLVRVQLSMS